MNGNHQNGSVGGKVGDEAGCVEAVHLRHLEINHDKIWFGVLEKFDCFPAVTGFVTHAPISVVIQQPAQATSNGWAIVRYENTNQNEISYLSDKARKFPDADWSLFAAERPSNTLDTLRGEKLADSAINSERCKTLRDWQLLFSYRSSWLKGLCDSVPKSIKS